MRDGSKGPLVVEAVKRRVVSRTHRRQQGDQETLVVIRSRDRDQVAPQLTVVSAPSFHQALERM